MEIASRLNLCNERSSKTYQQEKLIISVDVGSSFIKCVIYDGVFSIRGRSSVKLDTCVQEDGGCEIDPDHLWQQFLTCVRDAIDSGHCALEDILAMGFCTQRNTFITWNKETGTHFHNFISWKDVRSSQICQQWNDSFTIRTLNILSRLMYALSNKKRFAAGSIYQLKCGMVTPRLLWAIQTNHELREAIEVDKVHFGGIETWLLWKLTDGKVLQSEISLASSTGMFDPFMVGDQQAGTFGCCCFDFGSVKLTLGTGMFIDINTGNAAHASLHGIYPLVGWKINEDLTYLAESSAKDAGSALLWAQSIGLFNDVESTSSIAESVKSKEFKEAVLFFSRIGIASFRQSCFCHFTKFICATATTSVRFILICFSGGVYFVSAFSGLQAPINNDHACTMFTGLKPNTTKSHMVRAILESIAFGVYQIYKVMLLELNDAPKIIKCTGGISKNEFVCQLISDIAGIPLETMKNEESTSLGVAFMVGLSMGLCSNKNELKHFVPKGRIYTPTPERRDILLREFHKWQLAVTRSLDWYLTVT